MGYRKEISTNHGEPVPFYSECGRLRRQFKKEKWNRSDPKRMTYTTGPKFQRKDIGAKNGE